MNTFLTLLAICAVALAAYGLSEARRWRSVAREARSENEEQRTGLEAAKARCATAEAGTLRARK